MNPLAVESDHAPMDGAKPRPEAEELPRCAACGEVIGVYERILRLAGGAARWTSRAAEPDACRAGAQCFHADCHPRVASRRASLPLATN